MRLPHQSPLTRVARAMFAIAMLALAPMIPAAHAEGGPIVIDDGSSTDAPQTAQALCTLEPGPLGPQFTVWGPTETWTAHYTLLRPSSCTLCLPPQILDLKTVTFRVRWGSSACPSTGFTVELSIIGGMPDPGGSGCLVPNPAEVQCGPIQYDLQAQPVPQIVTLALPTGCCLSHPGFLSVRYLNVTGNCVPITNSSALCDPCAQFFSTSVSFPAITPDCPTLAQMEWFSVQTDCCSPTERLPRSWGRVKTLYR